MALAESPAPRTPPPKGHAESRARIERITARALALFGLVFGAQSIPMVIAQRQAMDMGPWLVLTGAVYGGLLMLAVVGIAAVWVRPVAVGFAMLYALVILVWPFVVVRPEVLESEIPWMWFLCTVATTAAGIAMPLVIACGYTLIVPMLYSLVRMLPAGGEVSAVRAGLDAVYAIILGLTVIIIITMLRQASAAVDTAQEAALRRYDIAVRQSASEVERVRIDALVHDSVLTTFLSAAAAQTREAQLLAGRMARDAMAALRSAGASRSDSVATVPIRQLFERIRSAAATFTMPFEVTQKGSDEAEIPLEALEAIYSATVQAMMNSTQHAGGFEVHRTLTLIATEQGGCEVCISDDGCGFDPAMVFPGRLGLSVSISERVPNSGGFADITSAPGVGTTVTVGWPDPVAPMDVLIGADDAAGHSADAAVQGRDRS